MQLLLLPWQLIFSARCLKSHLTGEESCRGEAAAGSHGTLTPLLEGELELPPSHLHKFKAGAPSEHGVPSSPAALLRES